MSKDTVWLVVVCILIGIIVGIVISNKISLPSGEEITGAITAEEEEQPGIDVGALEKGKINKVDIPEQGVTCYIYEGDISCIRETK